MIVDKEAIEEADSHYEIYAKRIKAEEVLPVYKDTKRTKFTLPLAEGLMMQPGHDQEREVRERKRVASDEDDEEEQEKAAEEAAAEEAEVAKPMPSDQEDFWSLNA